MDGEAAWVSRVDAAQELGVGLLRLDNWLNTGRLEKITTAKGTVGVDAESLAALVAFRESAGPARKLVFALGTIFRNV